MQTIKILGTGCPNCNRTSAVIQKVLDELKSDISLEKVTDIQEIMQYDVMTTPAVVMDDKVVIKGRVPSEEEIKTLIDESCCNDESCSCESDEESCCDETETSCCNDDDDSSCCDDKGTFISL